MDEKTVRLSIFDEEAGEKLCTLDIEAHPLKETFRRLGIKQREISSITGIHQSTISHFLNGLGNVPDKTKIILLEFACSVFAKLIQQRILTSVPEEPPKKLVRRKRANKK